MSRPRAPWWMYVLAASFLAYFALLFYSYCWGPELLGFLHSPGKDFVVLKGVWPNSPGERAGLQSGDRLVAIDGRTVRTWFDVWGLGANFQADRPVQLEIERGGKRLQVEVALHPHWWSLRERPEEGVFLSLFWGAKLVTLILAFIIGFSRPRDLIARLGAWFLAAVACTFPGVPYGMAATWRSLPIALSLLIWVGLIGYMALGPLLFSFFAVFPRKLFRARWPWVFVWAPPVLLSPWLVSFFYRIVYQPERVVGNPAWLFPAFIAVGPAYIVAALVALVLNYQRLQDVNERRRVRVLALGSGAAWLAPLLYYLAGQFPPLIPVFFSLPGRIPGAFLLLGFPLSFAYAILRHRVFDIRVMIRQGLQYALARRVLFSLVPVLAAILLLDLLSHGSEPLIEILRARGWIYAVLGGLAVVAQTQRQRWLEALDRRFFRERYAAQRLLREVVGEVRQAGSLERVAPRVVAHIEAALHPEFVALLVREPREPRYRTLAGAPTGQAPPEVPADSKLLAMVRLLGKPLEVPLTETGWLQQQLPQEETDFLRRARIDLLVPIATAAERTEALLVLGPKRSEEPYTREDQDLLVAIATSLALLLEKPAPPPERLSNAFEECPRCGTCYDTGTGHCTQEGASLSLIPVPRVLAGRYRLQRRLGRGGMGTVYAATDTALERRVAVKLIREDLVASADAAERFRREARTAASFAHPNVVTVHDFGLVAETRAFLVMELLEGLTLREELQAHRRLTAARTLEILRGVSAAVEAAHRRRLVHRDLKPENIFLVRADAAEVTKVLDFGLAKFLLTSNECTVDTRSGLLVGTLHYMAPEQLRSEAADASWDLWALAVIAYEMLTGARPFAGATLTEWQAAVLAGRLTPVADHLPDAPVRWQELFERILALEPARRPNSALMFFSELERALA